MYIVAAVAAAMRTRKRGVCLYLLACCQAVGWAEVLFRVVLFPFLLQLAKGTCEAHDVLGGSAEVFRM